MKNKSGGGIPPKDEGIEARRHKRVKTGDRIWNGRLEWE
jgi:hypothetical protein